MVHPGRLEDHAFIGPAHGPIDLPDQLAPMVGRQFHRFTVPALADIGKRRGVVVVPGDRRGVAFANGAVGTVGKVRPARVAVVLGGGPRSLSRGPGRHRFVLGEPAWPLPGIGAGFGFGAVPVQDGIDFRVFADSQQHRCAVRARGVALRLTDALELDAESAGRLDHRGLEVLGPVRVPAAFGRRHGGQRLPDVTGPRRVDTGRHPAEAVIVVPRENVHAVDTATPDLVGDQVRRHDLPQVAQVDGTRRAEAGSHDDGLLRGATLCRCEDLVRHSRDPIVLRVARHQAHPF